MDQMIWPIPYGPFDYKPKIECGFKMVNEQSIWSHYQFGEKHWTISTPFYIEMGIVLHVL